MLYATQVGVFEQRVSSNETRQKIAFHAAEAAINQGLEYVLANAQRMFDAGPEAMPDGVGGFRAGWFANDGVTPGWQSCAGHTGEADHPCGGELPVTAGSFFYDDPTTNSGTDSLPINAGLLPANTAARVSLVMCVVDFGDPEGGCLGAPSGAGAEQKAVAIIQLMGYGFADCSDVADLSTCTAQARIARPMSNFKSISGSPVVPLTAKKTFPPSGASEIVPNPNAGGVGVPISVWTNNNTACNQEVAVWGQGSWATCEMHEWYGQDSIPDDVVCNNTPCMCAQAESISYSAGVTTYGGIDIVVDDSFPCDLFEYYFGVPRSLYEVIKSSATIISNCSELGPDSTGLYWVSGSSCHIAANAVVGSPQHPIVLISAASATRMEGGVQIFGVLYIFDGEDINAEFSSIGTDQVYGAVIVDASFGNYNGTFQIVYSEAILARASGVNGLGSVSGGWRDFGLPDWQ